MNQSYPPKINATAKITPPPPPPRSVAQCMQRTHKAGTVATQAADGRGKQPNRAKCSVKADEWMMLPLGIRIA
jgi:hypothetical protein